MDTLSPPPRRVPLSVYLLALFGGYYNFGGWLGLGIGAPFAAMFLMIQPLVIGWRLLAALLFIVPGLVIVLPRLIYGVRSLVLMKYGLPAVGTLVAMTKTPFSRPGSEYGPPVFRLTFQYLVPGRQPFEARYSTDELLPAWEAFYQQTQNRGQTAAPPSAHAPQATVLYLPSNPAVAVLPLSFRRGITFDDRGNIHGSVLPAILSIITPALVMLVDGVLLFLIFSNR